MIIRKIIINNYRQFKGKQKIVLFSKEGTNINVIKGTTGAGKSCIHNMVHWVLYNDDRIKSTNKKDAENLLCNNVFMNLDEGSSKTVEVSIDFGNHDETIHQISRKVNIKRLDELNHSEHNNVQTILTLNRNTKNFKTVDKTSEKKAFIEKHFPSYISDLFFFDGEKLDAFFDSTGKDKKLDDFIKRASGLDTVENIIKKLGKIENSLVKGDDIDEMEILRKKKAFEREETDLKTSKEKLQNLDKELRKLNNAIEKGKEQRRLFESLDKENKRLDALEDLIKGKDDAIEEAHKGFYDLIMRIGPSVILQKELSSFVDLVKRLEKENKIPPQLSLTFVKELIKQGKCICGRDLEKDSKKILDEIASAENYVEDALIYTDGRTHINYMLEDANSFEKLAKEFTLKINDAQTKKESHIKDKDKIIDNLKGLDQDEIKLNMQKYEINTSKKEEVTLALGSERKNNEIIKRRLTNAKKDYNKIINRSEKSNIAAKKVRMVLDAKDKLGELLKDSFKKLREKIEKETNTQFKKMMWKKGVFDRIELDDNFRFKVYKVRGLDAFASLSQGERQILAFSFIAALSYVANIDRPLIIDTPFGRIDDDPTENIAKALRDHLSDFQITFLLTGKEFSQDVKQVLRSNIGHSYLLNFDDENDFTILEGLDL